MYNNLLNNFEEYIINTSRQDFLANIMTNNNFSSFLIDHKLFFKKLDCLMLRYGQDSCFQIFKLLCLKDKNNNFLSEDMYTMFEYDNFDLEYFNAIFYFLEFKEMINTNELKEIIETILVNKCKYVNVDFIQYLLNSKYKNIVIDNFEMILDNCYGLLDLKKIIKDENLKERYKKYINKKPDNIIYEMLIKGFDLNLEKVKNEKIFDTLNQIIKELLEYENINYSDIDFIGLGAYNFVVSIGSKVLKIGQKREVFKMDNNKRFLKPMLRTEINKINSDEILGCVEITEKVSTEDITKKDIYILYKELRDKGYIWTDCRIDNVGKLLKDNKIYFNELNPTLNAINYNNHNLEELKKGELVIIDNDYIYSEKDFKNLPYKTQENYMDNVEEYESEYQEESRRKK